MSERFCGIDYSMSSPSLCLSSGDGNYDIYYLCKQVKLRGEIKAVGTQGTNFRFFGEASCTLDNDQVRYDWISDWAISKMSNVSRACIEDYAFNATGRVHATGENTGLFKHKMYKAGIEFETVAPMAAKRFAGASKQKGIKDSKDLMEQRFIEKTGIDLRGIFELGEKVKNPISDIIDSYWICEYLMGKVLTK